MLQFEDLGIKTRPGRQRYVTQCPECSSKRKKQNVACLTVNDEPGNRWYKCHHCGWSGNLDIQDKYEKVREHSGMPTKEKVYGIEARNYLSKRGISLKTAMSRNVYEMSKQGTLLLGFPFFMHMTLVNVKFLNFKWKKGEKGIKWHQISSQYNTRIIPWGMNFIKTHDDDGNKLKDVKVIITEGEIDALTWVECGYENVISIPQGAPSVNAKDFKKEFAYLTDKYVQDIFKEVDIFILSVDNDEAGLNLLDKMGMILGKDRCRIARYPTGYKDINEVFKGNEEKGLIAKGKEGVTEVFEKIKSFPIKGIIKPSDVINELMAYRENGFTAGLGIGVPEIDKLFTIKRKLLVILTGVPGSGKTTIIRWWIIELIRHNVELDLKFAWFTPENRPISREHARMAEVLTGKSIKTGRSNSMSDEMFKKAIRFIEKHFYIISPDKKNFEAFGGSVNKDNLNTLDSIQRYLIYLRKTENIFGFVIDAWNKIEHEQPKYQTETNFISQQLDRVIDFIDYWDLCAIIIVHPKKIEQQGNNYKMPSLYDVKGSSAWKEKADIGIIVHRYKMKKKSPEDLTGDEDEDEKWITVANAPTIIKTEKIRFEETGNEDRVRIEMNGIGRFEVSNKKSQPGADPDERIEAGVFEDPDNNEDLPF
jgi:twinkle protein